MKLSISIIIAMCFADCSFCQVKQIAVGMIVDSVTLEPIPYVNIQIKNSTSGTTTDNLGNFSIEVSRSDTLMLTFIGYKKVQLPMWNWETAMVLLKQETILLKTVTFRGARDEDYYAQLFEEQNILLKKSQKRLPFYFSKDKKEKIKVTRLEDENERVKNYVEFVANNPELKSTLMKKHKLTEMQYYAILSQFNEKNHRIMYYLSASELLTLINHSFDRYTEK